MPRIPPRPPTNRPAQTPTPPRAPDAIPGPAPKAGGLHGSPEGREVARANPYVTERRATGAAGTTAARATSVVLQAPREMVTAYRDGFRAGAERWLGSALPAGVRSAFGREGVAEFSRQVVDGLPRAIAETWSPAGGVVKTIETIYRVATAVGTRLQEVATRGADLASRLLDLGQGALEKVGEPARKVIGRLMADGGKGLVEFAGNLARGVRTGFEKFSGNIAEHLRSGLVGWLKSALPEDMELPRRFDAKELFGFAKDILKLTGERVLGQLEKRLSAPVMNALKWGEARVEDLVKRGPARLAGDLLGAVKGAAGKALETGGRVGEWARSTGAETAEVLEGALSKTIPVVIDMLAGTLGLGGVGGKVRDVVEKTAEAASDGAGAVGGAVQEVVEDTVDAAKGAAEAVADAFLSVFGAPA